MGSGDDGAHSQNEKIEVRNYIEGVSGQNYYVQLHNIKINSIEISYILHSKHNIITVLKKCCI